MNRSKGVAIGWRLPQTERKQPSSSLLSSPFWLLSLPTYNLRNKSFSKAMLWVCVKRSLSISRDRLLMQQIQVWSVQMIFLYPSGNLCKHFRFTWCQTNWKINSILTPPRHCPYPGWKQDWAFLSVSCQDHKTWSKVLSKNISFSLDIWFREEKGLL